MKKRIALGVLLASVLSSLAPLKVSAHCPLCTGGAGVAALVATYFGVRYGALAVLLGGFSVALALWMAHRPQKSYINHQSVVLFWAIYLSTIIPFYLLLSGDYLSRYVSLGGDYGSLTNRTYVIDMFIIGAIIGSLIVFLSPKISSWVSRKLGGKRIKFQGLIINFVLLIAASVLLQVWPR